MTHPDTITSLATAHQLDLLHEAIRARLAAPAAADWREPGHFARWLVSRVAAWSTPQRTLRGTDSQRANPRVLAAHASLNRMRTGLPRHLSASTMLSARSRRQVILTYRRQRARCEECA